MKLVAIGLLPLDSLLLFLDSLFRGIHSFGHHLTLSDIGTGIQ